MINRFHLLKTVLPATAVIVSVFAGAFLISVYGNGQISLTLALLTALAILIPPVICISLAFYLAVIKPIRSLQQDLELDQLDDSPGPTAGDGLQRSIQRYIQRVSAGERSRSTRRQNELQRQVDNLDAQITTLQAQLTQSQRKEHQRQSRNAILTAINRALASRFTGYARLASSDKSPGFIQQQRAIAKDIRLISLELQDEAERHADAATVEIRQLIDEVINLWQTDTPIRILPVFDRDLPDYTRTDVSLMQAMLFNYIASHTCRMRDRINQNEMDAATGTEVEIRVDVTLVENSLVFSIASQGEPDAAFAQRLATLAALQPTLVKHGRTRQAIPEGILSIAVEHSGDSLQDLGATAVIVARSKLEEQSLVSRLQLLGVEPVNRSYKADAFIVAIDDEAEILKLTGRVDRSRILLLANTCLLPDITQLHSPVQDQELRGAISTRLSGKRSTPAGAADRAIVPVFDLQLSLQRANHRPDLAEEFLEVFIETIPDDQRGIAEAFAGSDRIALRERVHKLMGAVRYCGLPKLTRALERLQTLAQSGTDQEIKLSLLVFNSEVQALQDWYDPDENLFDTSILR